MKMSDIDLENVVSLLRNRVAVTKYYYDKLPKELRELSFYVSDLEKLRQIELVKKSLERAIEKGESFNSWKSNLNIEGIKNLSNARLETVYRTNINTVYNQSSRYNAYTSDVTPYLMYTAVGDERTRPEHLKLDGTIKRADSEFWDKYNPPIAFNCRCGTIPLDTDTAKEMGISSKSLDSFPEPEKGFGKSKMGDVLSGTKNAYNKAIDQLPKNSPYRQKFIDSKNNIKNLVDIWFNKNQDIISS